MKLHTKQAASLVTATGDRLQRRVAERPRVVALEPPGVGQRHLDPCRVQMKAGHPEGRATLAAERTIDPAREILERRGQIVHRGPALVSRCARTRRAGSTR